MAFALAEVNTGGWFFKLEVGQKPLCGGLLPVSRPASGNRIDTSHLAVKRPTRGCGAPKVRVCRTSTRSRLSAQVDFRRELRPIEFVAPRALVETNLHFLLPGYLWPVTPSRQLVGGT